MPPSRDNFARWRDDQVTRWANRALAAGAEANKAAWVMASWENGGGSREMLQELRVRADAYRSLAETTYEGFCDMLGEDPRDE